MFWTLVSSILLSFLKGVELTTSLAAASEQPDQTKDKRKISSNEKRKSPSGELKDDQGTPRKFSKTGAVERAKRTPRQTSLWNIFKKGKQFSPSPTGQCFPFSGFKLFWTLSMQTKTKNYVKHVIVLVHYSLFIHMALEIVFNVFLCWPLESLHGL